MSKGLQPKEPNLLPIAVAALGFVAGFILLVPLGCTMESVSIEDGSSGMTTSTTSCSNVIGLDYSGQGRYNPPLWPAALAGVAAATVGGRMTVLFQRGRRPRPVSSPTLGRIGVAVNAVWVSFLSVLGLFSGGSLDPQWRTVLVFVGLIGLPGVLAAFGLRRRPALLLVAGIICVPLSFISLAGATLPLLVPATLYLVAYARA